MLSFVREEPQMNALEAQMNGMKTLRAGFTTVRNLGDDGATLALREAIKRGWVQGPRIVDAASSISTTGGHMDGRGGLNDDLVAHLPGRENLCDGVDSCRKVVRRQIDRGADVIKSPPRRGQHGTVLATRMTRMRHAPLSTTAHSYGKVAVHSHGATGSSSHCAPGGFDRALHGVGRRNLRTMTSRGPILAHAVDRDGYLERLAATPSLWPDVKTDRLAVGITGHAAQASPASSIASALTPGIKHGLNDDESEFGTIRRTRRIAKAARSPRDLSSASEIVRRKRKAPTSSRYGRSAHRRAC